MPVNVSGGKGHFMIIQKSKRANAALMNANNLSVDGVEQWSTRSLGFLFSFIFSVPPTSVQSVDAMKSGRRVPRRTRRPRRQEPGEGSLRKPAG